MDRKGEGGDPGKRGSETEELRKPRRNNEKRTRRRAW